MLLGAFWGNNRGVLPILIFDNLFLLFLYMRLLYIGARV